MWNDSIKEFVLDALKKYNTKLKSWVEGKIPTKTSDLTNDSGFITDAPKDTKQYARKDGSWVEVQGGGGEGGSSIEHFTCPVIEGLNNNVPQGKTPATFSDINDAYNAGKDIILDVCQTVQSTHTVMVKQFKLFRAAPNTGYQFSADRTVTTSGVTSSELATIEVSSGNSWHIYVDDLKNPFKINCNTLVVNEETVYKPPEGYGAQSANEIVEAIARDKYIVLRQVLVDEELPLEGTRYYLPMSVMYHPSIEWEGGQYPEGYDIYFEINDITNPDRKLGLDIYLNNNEDGWEAVWDCWERNNGTKIFSVYNDLTVEFCKKVWDEMWILKSPITSKDMQNLCFKPYLKKSYINDSGDNCFDLIYECLHDNEVQGIMKNILRTFVVITVNETQESSTWDYYHQLISGPSNNGDIYWKDYERAERTWRSGQPYLESDAENNYRMHNPLSRTETTSGGNTLVTYKYNAYWNEGRVIYFSTWERVYNKITGVKISATGSTIHGTLPS